MSRYLTFAFGIFAYAVGMAGLTYFLLFVGGWSFLPTHVDSAQPRSLAVALLVNVGLLVLWGLQHSLMARSKFERSWGDAVSKSSERSLYVLCSGVVLFVLCWYWQPTAGSLWKVESPVLWWALTALHLGGWTFAVASSFVINHFELFGLQQVYDNFQGKDEPTSEFTEKSLYAWVRHPLQLGILIGLWVGPSMSASRLILAAGMTCYILIGLYFEERDLVALLGEPYRDYQSRVRMLIPIPKRRPTSRAPIPSVFEPHTHGNEPTLTADSLTVARDATS